MLKRFKEIFNSQQFQPTLAGIFLNPFYFLRKGLLKGIKKNKKYIKGIVLDFGCGSKPYKNLFNFEKYIGLDIGESGHNHYQEEIDLFYDGKKIPFGDKYFDSIFSSEVLEHIFNLNEIFIELNRVLKTKGYFLFTIPFAWDEHEIPYDFARYTSYGINFILKKYGFNIIKLEKSTNYVETVFQICAAYICQYILPKNKYINFLLTIFLIAPINLLGLLFSLILPKSYSYYNNIIIVSQKTSDIVKKINVE